MLEYWLPIYLVLFSNITGLRRVMADSRYLQSGASIAWDTACSFYRAL